MNLNTLVDEFIKLIEQHRTYEKTIMELRYELEKWQSAACSGIPEEGLQAALDRYDYLHKDGK